MIRSTVVLCLLGVTAIAATPIVAAEGTLLIANRNGGSVSLLDLETETEIARLAIGPIIPHEMAASPDGRLAVTGEYGSNDNPGRHLVVIDVPAAEIVARIDLGPDSRPHSIWFLPDSRHVVATMEQSDQIALVDVIDGEVLRTWPTGAREGHMVRLSPNGARAYVASRGGDGTLSVIWLNEDRAPAVVRTGAGAEGIAVSPDGSEIWVANRGDETVSIVDAESLEVTATLAVSPTNRIEFLPDGRALIPGISDSDNTVRLITFYDGESKQQISSLSLPRSNAAGTGVRMLAADRNLFLADSALNAILLVDPDSDEVPRRIMINADNPDGMAWSPLRVEVLDR